MKSPIEDSASEAKAEKEEGTTLVVGIKMDAGSRELLTWTLLNIAKAGERVIALHVLPAVVSDSVRETSTLITHLNALNAVLSVYEVFCSLKQIDLQHKISWGSSMRRVLAQEASSASASKLIVGVSNRSIEGIRRYFKFQFLRFGFSSLICLFTRSCKIDSYSSISVAKYCAKKISRGCLVLAIDNGKIIFQKVATGDRIIDDLSIGKDFVRSCKINEQHEKDTGSARSSLPYLPAACKARLSSDRINNCAAKFFLRFHLLKNENCVGYDSLSKHLSSPPVSAGLCVSSSKYGEGSFNAISMMDQEKTFGCVPLMISESPRRRTWWPALQRVFSIHKKNSLKVKPMTSVTRLAIQLPSKYSTSLAVHPDHNQAKSAGATPVIPSEVDAEAKDLPKEWLSIHEKCSSFFRLFSYNELEQATSNFSSETVIGKGGNSRVYKGRLCDGKELAVKVLERSDDVLKNFISEIEIMSNLHHKNIISLTGYCFEKKNLILVYDFLSRGSLEDNIYGNKGGKNGLGWAERYKIAVGVAEALECLHESSNAQSVIHWDVKSSNILLSDDFEPQLSDFGLAQLASKCTKNTTRNDLAGTFGYLAPECFSYGEVDEKVDVYAFGVVLLELLSGRKPVCIDCPKGEESLVLWAKPILQAWKLEQMLDSHLGENYNTDEMERMCLAAYLCIRQAPGCRPSMHIVVKLIKGDDEAIEWAKLEFGSFMLYDDMEDEAALNNLNIQSHINLALLGMDDDDNDYVALSASCRAHSLDFTTSNASLECLKDRRSRFN